MPSANDVITTPAIAIVSLSACAITMKLVAFKAMVNAMRKLENYYNNNKMDLATFKSKIIINYDLSFFFCGDNSSGVFSKEREIYFFNNGRNGQITLISIAGKISAINKIPADDAAHTSE